MKRLESSVKAPDRNAQFEELYAQYADLIIASRPGEDDTARQVEEVMRSIGMKL